MWSVCINPRGQSWFSPQQSTENTTKTLMSYKSGFHWKTHHDVAFRIFLPFRQYQRVYKGLLNAHQTAKNVPVDHINTSSSPSLISIRCGILKTTINHTRPHPKCLPSFIYAPTPHVKAEPRQWSGLSGSEVVVPPLYCRLKHLNNYRVDYQGSVNIQPQNRKTTR